MSEKQGVSSRRRRRRRGDEEAGGICPTVELLRCKAALLSLRTHTGGKWTPTLLLFASSGLVLFL